MKFFFHDLRLAARGLRRSPTFTIVAIATLAVGIGATTAVFAVVYGVLVRSLPFPNADRFVQIVQVLEGSGVTARAGLSPEQFANLQEHATKLDSVGTWAPAERTLTGIDFPIRLSGAAVTASIFSGFGVAPILGRTFQEEDSYPGADPVVILSDRTWRRMFGSDRAVLERRIKLNDVSTRVIGVMPATFVFPSLARALPTRDSVGQLTEVPEFWLPAPLFARAAPTSGFTLFQSFGFLPHGISPGQAEAEARLLAGPLPNGLQGRVEVVSARDEMGLPARRLLLTFQAGVVLILLIAALNVVHLLVARRSEKHSEVALKRALGATRIRVAGDVLGESMILGLCGGTLGCALAYVLTAALQTLPPHILPRLRDIRVDEAVLLFAFSLSTLTSLTVGVLSGLQASRATPWLSLHGHPGTIMRSRGLIGASRLIVVIQIAAAMVLLTAAGLLVNSFIRLGRVDLGFDPNDVVTFQLELPPNRRNTIDASDQFIETLSAELRSRTRAEFVAAEGRGGIGYNALVIDGQRVERARISYAFVTADYFRTLRLPVLQGRQFFAQGRSRQSPEVIVNDAFVRLYVTNGNAIGRRIEWGGLLGPREIVGVVANARQSYAGSQDPLLYIPGLSGIGSVTVLVRIPHGAGTVMTVARESIRRLEPDVAPYNAMTLSESLRHLIGVARFQSLLSVACATLAVLLAVMGLYGLLAHSVRARYHEIGVRMALGASVRGVLVRVLAQGLILTSIGLILGLIGSYLAAQVLSSMLFTVSPHDTTTFSITTLVFLVVAALACYLSARRATRVDPVVVLRAE